MSGHEQERLSAYLDRELPPAERAAVAAHLAACAECAARLAEFAAVDEATAALEATAPSGYFDALPGRLRARLGSRPLARRLPTWTWAAAAALLLAVVTPLALLKGPAVQPGAGAREAAASPPAAPAPAEAAPPYPAAAAAAPATLRPAPRAELDQAERRRVVATAAPVPAPAPPAQNAAAPAKLESEPGFASAPAESPSRPSAAPVAAPLSEMLARATPHAPPAVEAAQAADVGDALESGARRQAPAASEEKEAVETRASGALAESVGGAHLAGKDGEWQRLKTARPKTAAEWRRLREELRRFAAQAPEGPYADTARVRTIEAGHAAWRASGDSSDEAVFRRDAAAYLEREDARDKPRVRELMR